MSLCLKQKQRIQLRHKHSIERHGYTPAALFWSSQEIQEIRFLQFSNFISTFLKLAKRPITILDVGCGFGDLKFFLQQQGHVVQYTGIDVSPAMVFSGNAQSPSLSLKEGELFDFDFADNNFDFVFLSGALNEVVDDNGNYALSVIKEMYRLAKLGVGFNLLDSAQSWVKTRSDLQSFEKVRVQQFCQEFCRDVACIDDYLEIDFTILLKNKD